MNLPLAEAKLVCSGRKRLLWLPVRLRDGRRLRCAYREGERYGVTGQGFSVFVGKITLRKLSDLDLKDARAGGYRTTAAMREGWLRARDRAWVHKVETEQRCKRSDWLTREEVDSRWEQRWADQQVWQIEVRPDDGARLLHRDSSRGYTTNPMHAMPHEPEAISEEDLMRLNKKDAERRRREKERNQQRMRKALDKMPLQERIRFVERHRWTVAGVARQFRHILWLLESGSSTKRDEQVRSMISSSLMAGTRSGSCEESTRLENALSSETQSKLLTAIRAAEAQILQAV